MKFFSFVLLNIFFTFCLLGQGTVEEFVKQGIGYHDNGEFEKAILSYQKALEIEPNSPLANYEISLSYFSLGNYEKVIEFSDYVLKEGKQYETQAYLTKGSALDLLGKTNKSIKLFEKAIGNGNEHYLLYFNLALNYYKTNKFKAAESNASKAIEINNQHASSHLMIANINNLSGNKIPAILAAHIFLFLEPNSQRSDQAIQILASNFGGNVSKSKDQPNTTNIEFSPNENNQFSAAELMISLTIASNSTEENKEKTPDELFVENTASLFKMLGEMKPEQGNEFWWDNYINFLNALANSEHLETYCKFITQSANENSRTWLKSNEERLIKFDAWLRNE